MQNKQSKNKKHAGVSTGIILGAAFGILFGLLFLDGNIAMGMILGCCLASSLDRFLMQRRINKTAINNPLSVTGSSLATAD
jgi:uncharacterized membrane protein